MVTIDAMTVAHTEHPQALDTSQVLNTNETVLVWFGLRGDETLPCFNSERFHDRGLILS